MTQTLIIIRASKPLPPMSCGLTPEQRSASMVGSSIHCTYAEIPKLGGPDTLETIVDRQPER